MKTASSSSQLPDPKAPKTVEQDRILERQLAFGYTYEDLRMLLGPTATTGVQPIASMGNDTPLAVLSDKPKHLYQYFKQIFAQVTNPALDCIREELVTATETFLGSEGNLLDPGPHSCRMIRLDNPLLDNRPARPTARGRPRRLQGHHARRAVSRRPGRQRARKGLRPSSAPPPTRRSPTAATSSSSPTATSTPPMPRCQPCWSWAASTTTSCAPAPAPWSPSSWKPAKPARSTTSPPSSATARMPSTPTWPSIRIHQMIKRPDARHGFRQGGLQLPQGLHQGRGQNHGQDGHLHRRLLPRRADFRNHRPQHRPGEQILLRHLQPLRGLGHRANRRRSAHPPPRRVPGPPHRGRGTRARIRRHLSMAQRRRIPPVQSGNHPPAPKGGAHRQLRGLQAVCRARSTTRARTSRPCAA